MTVTCERALGMVWLPDTFSLIVSTPSRISMRTVRCISSAPSTTIAIDSRYSAGGARRRDCRCWSAPGWPPAGAAPGRVPALMASRTAMSRRGLADPPLRQDVKPASSTMRACASVSSVCSSGGMSPVSAMLALCANGRCAWPSTRPGMSVCPDTSILSAEPRDRAARTAGAPRRCGCRGPAHPPGTPAAAAVPDLSSFQQHGIHGGARSPKSWREHRLYIAADLAAQPRGDVARAGDFAINLQK